MRFVSAFLIGLIAHVIAGPSAEMSLEERGLTTFTITCGRGATDLQCIESFQKGVNGVPDTVNSPSLRAESSSLTLH